MLSITTIELTKKSFASFSLDNTYALQRGSPNYEAPPAEIFLSKT